MELNICHLYPDLLNMYGDRGNIIALKKRAEWRGIRVNIYNISLGDVFDGSKYDIVFLGGGQDYEQEIIQDDILYQKGTEIKNSIEDGVVFLCICGGYQLMGQYYKTIEGKEIKALGALNLWTIAGTKRMIGDIIFESDLLKQGGFDGKVVGFENHSGRTYLGKGVQPLGRVVSGYGNNGEDGFEGAVYKNVFCSYSHGSLLPKNYRLTDHLLRLALERKYGGSVLLEEIDSGFEELARISMINRLTKKRF